jgi:hypothetical protein
VAIQRQMAGGDQPAVISPPSEMIAARSSALHSSRTFPGQ